MFIYSVKGNTLKLFGIIALAITAVLVLIFALPSENAVMAGSIFEGK